MIKIKFRSYGIISRAVEDGVDYGYQRAHKHTDTPNEELMKQEIKQAVMSALDEIIDFEKDTVVKRRK